MNARISKALDLYKSTLAKPGELLERGLSQGLQKLGIAKGKSELIGTWTNLLSGIILNAVGAVAVAAGVLVTPSVVAGSVALLPCLTLYGAGLAMYLLGDGLQMAAFGQGRKDMLTKLISPARPAGAVRTVAAKPEFKKAVEEAKPAADTPPPAPAETPKP